MADLKNLHTKALDQFQAIQNKEKTQRELAVEDTLFAHAEDGQWSEDALEKRGDRPRYTFNRVIGVIKQITGAHKQNRSQIKVAPDSEDADDKTADIMAGLIRKIEKNSDAQAAYDNSFDEKTAGGYGGWRVLTQFKEDSVDQQEICIEPILSACTSHFIDIASKKIDGSDANHQFLISDMTTEEFERKFPKATVTDFNTDTYRQGICNSWFRDNVVRVAEYWVKTPVTKTICLMSDGKTIDKDDEGKVLDELAEQGITVVKSREVKSHKVEMYKMNGAEVLSGPHAFAGKYIPLVPDYGETITVNNQKYVRGIVRPAKDSNRTYNYARSTDIETYALTPKDPYWLTKTMAAGHTEQLESFPKKNQPFMFYNADPKHPGPPARTGAPSVSAAGSEISRQSIDDMHATTSMYPPAMGNAPQLLSEKSVRSQAEKGDIGAYIYQDNHEKALSYTGKILVDLIPRIIDTKQAVQILGIDGKSETVQVNAEELDNLNQTVIDEETGQPVIVNDLSLGRYNISIETGPAFSTQREESASQLIDLATNHPVFAELTPDLIAKNMNIVESEEFVRRLRKWAITQGIAEPTDEEIEELGLNQPQQPDPGQQALTENVTAQTNKTIADTESVQAKTQETLVKTQSEAIDAYSTLLTAYEKQIELGLPLTDQQRTLLVTQGDIVRDAQNITQDDMPNSEQSADIARMLEQGQQLTAL